MRILSFIGPAGSSAIASKKCCVIVPLQPALLEIDSWVMKPAWLKCYETVAKKAPSMGDFDFSEAFRSPEYPFDLFFFISPWERDGFDATKVCLEYAIVRHYKRIELPIIGKSLPEIIGLLNTQKMINACTNTEKSYPSKLEVHFRVLQKQKNELDTMFNNSIPIRFWNTKTNRFVLQKIY